MGNSWRVISYYTTGTPYEQESVRLLESMNKFSIPNKIYPRPSLGSWEKNTQIKASIILDAMNEFPNEIIIWVDVDAVFEKRPDFFDTLDREGFDVCAYHLKSRYNPNELLSGTIIFSNNRLSKNIVTDWMELNKTNKTWDQKNLQEILESEKYNKTTRIILLPQEYIKIDKHDTFQPGIKDSDVVVRHYQASRRLKGMIK